MTPGPWRIVKVMNKARETRLAVARDVGAQREYVCSASGRRSTFCTKAGAQAALRAVLAADPHANGCPDSPGICECFRVQATGEPT